MFENARVLAPKELYAGLPEMKPNQALSFFVNELSCMIYKEALKNKTNTAFSSLSIYLCLAMLFEGTTGKVKEEISSILNLPKDDKTRHELLKEAIKDLSVLKKEESYDENEFGTPETIEVLKTKVGNSLWLPKNSLVNEKYQDTLKANFQALVESKDFEDPATVKTINSWISDNTYGLIKQALDKIHPEALLVLVNTVYFKARWNSPFGKEATKSLNFTDINGKVAKRPFMFQSSQFLYVKVGNSQIVTLDYQSSDYQMILKLEPKGNLNHITSEEIETLDKHKDYQKIDLFLPKFEFGTNLDVAEILKTLGLKEMFESNTTGFQGIVKDPSTACAVDSIIHKSQIIVDEKGTEAAAVTIIQMVTTCIDPDSPMELKFDRPFSFHIRDKKKNLFLFSGAFTGIDG